MRFPLLIFFIVLIQTLQLFEASDTIQNIEDLKFDQNNRLISNWLLYSDESACEEIVLSAWGSRNDFDFRDLAPMSLGLQKQFFGEESSSCVAVALTMGVPQHLVLFPLPESKIENPEVSDLKEWIREIQLVELGFVSYLPNDATIYWINFQGERFNVGHLQPGELNILWQVTTISHKFEVVDDVTQEIVLQYTVRHHGVVGIGDSGSYVNSSLDFTKEIEGTLRNEWYRSRRVQRTFSELGFAKGRLPSDVFASMSAFYYNNRQERIREEWEHDNKGYFVNWWEADVYMIQMPWGLKRYWQKRLKVLVEEWVGLELELQDIYGMRRYERGARLLTHVDREATHAASLIINVAQGDLIEPWPIEVYDHNDRLHEIIMEEGDIVFYESARSLHGRNQPLQGGYYVNLFSHYRPMNEDESWFVRENSPHSPKPLIELEGCERVEVTEEDAEPYESTRCLTDLNENGEGTEILVPTLRMPIEKLEGPEDLVNWWHKTANPPQQQYHDHDEL